MINILVVDDSNLIANALHNLITEKLGFNCIVARDMKSAAKVLLQYKGKFDVALLDLGLPDAPKGEVVDFITKFDIPTIVLTGSDTDEEKFRHKNIVDYVIKDGSYSLEYAVSVVNRIVSNKNLKVLIVDDSKITCSRMENLLQRYQLQTYTAYSSMECLEVLNNNPDIKIIYIDYLMPKMNGLMLTREIRRKYSKEDISIIALSGEANKKIISKFLKYGANDFIYKGFTEEEFFVRLNSNLEILELFQDAKDKANKDYLTGMYNRRYLFDAGEEIFNRIKSKKDNSLSVVIIDIDNFKEINDTLGHEVGDLALKEVPKILVKSLTSDSLCVRLGGEEFCILLENKSLEELKTLLENLRFSFENNTLIINDKNLSFTVSIGVCAKLQDSLTKMLNKADYALYNAKKFGKNRIEYYES